MEELICEGQINEFFHEINTCFPSLVAGVLTDDDGFPIGSKINRLGFDLGESELALLTISNRFKLKNADDYIEIKTLVDKMSKINLLLIIEKNRKRADSFIRLKDVIKRYKVFQSI